MPNFQVELFLDDTSVQQMSTTLCRRRKSFSTTGLGKYDNSRNNFVVYGSGKNRKSTASFVQDYQEEIKEESNGSSLEDLIQQLRSELQQTRALVAKLETRLEQTEQTSQVIVGELKNLLSENESESHTTAVEIDQESEEGDDDMKIDLDDDEFYISSSLINQSHQEEIPIIDNEREVTSQSESSIIQHVEDNHDTNDSYNRICSALQNLINDGQVALQKPNSSSHQLLGLPQTTTRPRAQSWSSNVSSWIMNHYNSPPVVCECGSCWLCLESSNNSLSSTTTTTRTTPKSSRANSVSLIQRPTFSFVSQQQELDNKRQVNLAGIKKQYRKKLERRFDYRKSCDDLETELQKLITTAISTGMEHGLMHSPVHHQYHDNPTGDSDYNYFRNHDDSDENEEEKFSSFSKWFEIFRKREQFKELEGAILNDNNDNYNEKGSSKWRRRIWNYLQKMGVNFSKKDDNNSKENVDDDDDNENNGYSSYSSYSSYGSYNSSWKSSSCDYQENSNEDSSNPFPSSFINTLNIGQNIFNFNVNLINSTAKNNYNNKTTNNYFNETASTNNYYNNNTTINNHEEKSSQLNSTSKKLQSLTSKCMNFLAMIGLVISMSQTVVSNPTTATVTPSLVNVAARNIIRNSAKRRRGGKDMVLMIKMIKYITVLLVGWVAGRIGKNQKKESSDKNNRITEIPLIHNNIS